MENLKNFELVSKQQGFTYIHNVSYGENVSTSHIDKELFSVIVLLNGELDYIIEGKRIHLQPQDILLVGNNELHRSIFKEGLECEYILLMVNIDFFVKHNCTELSDIFINRALGSNNTISHDKVLSSGLFDVSKRLDNYASEENPNLVVVSSVIIELLYNLDKQVKKADKSTLKQNKIKEIINYINEHLTEKISLETIANHFYMAREYLCKLFKQSTGFTVNKYIAYKRIVLVREYNLEGMSLSLACEKVGFNDYSAFYRAYQKIMNESPSQGMSKINF